MVSNRPIIAIGPNGSDFAEIITETNTGIFFDYSEKMKLKSVILDFYKQFWRVNCIQMELDYKKYSRKNLTRELVEVINKI
jgi:hypothetical protein